MSSSLPQTVTARSLDRVALINRALLRGRCGAFSLVEVVVALGVCVFAVLPVVGLLPMALNSAKEATETTQTAKIIQRVANELLQTPFAQLSSQLGERRFNYDGVEVTTAGDAYFTVVTNLDDLSIPGASAPSSHIYRVAINVDVRGGRVPKRVAITIADTGY